MVHSLDPVIFYIWKEKELGVRWYGLSYMLGFLAAYSLIHWLAKRGRTQLKPDQVADFIVYGALGTLIGGRLGYCVFYNPELFTIFKTSFPFWGVLAVNEGGMASHGGMIGIVVACILFARKYHINRLHLFDLTALVGGIGIFFGRIANFINGELVGRPCSPDFPLAVKFPQDILGWIKESPERLKDLTDVVSHLGVVREQWLEWVSGLTTNPGLKATVQNTLFRVVEAIQSGNAEIKAAIEPVLTPRYPSQIFGAIAEGLVVFLVLFWFWRRPRKPGVVGSLFLVIYSIMRIVDESFRMPDAHIGFQWLGLTRGQWLSVIMFFVGLGFLFLYGKRQTLPLSGWKKRA